MLNSHQCIRRSLLNLEVEDRLPEVQVSAHSHSAGVCSTCCTGVQMCHLWMEVGPLHEIFGGLSPVLRGKIINSRIIGLERQTHRQIYCTFIGTASG